ncbi:small ribosomal subunit protein bS1m-like [Clavelina lepadiformis]|uniref:Uncharacterized protein n=1 Tax=Clavelina lepadiformis TaxID=159417 RepID=A0ABP0F7A0_CLALP
MSVFRNCLYHSRRLSCLLRRTCVGSFGNHQVKYYNGPAHFIHDSSRLLEKLGATSVRETQPESFATMLRHSAFVQVGEHTNLKLIGKIVEMQEQNVYVDFGGKFYAVCSLLKIPKKDHKYYHRGVEVVIILNNFEESARFLGSNTDTTLLEANAKLIGLYGKDEGTKERETLIADDQLLYEDYIDDSSMDPVHDRASNPPHSSEQTEAKSCFDESGVKP